MSLNGLNNTVFPLTIDGTTALDVSSLTIDGTNIDIAGLVPYTGATQTLDMGAQNIQTSHTPSAPNDVINLTTLQSAVTYVDTSVALTYLNKITTSSQTVAGQVTFNKPVIIDDSLTVNPTKTANLASVVDVSPNYKRVETDADVTANYRFGSISNAGGIYTATTTGDFATLGLANLTANKLYKINLYVRAYPTAIYTTSLQLYSSADGTSPAISLDYSASYTPASPNTFQLITGNFVIPVGYTKLILLCLNTKTPTYITPVEWYGLELFDMGVALTNASMPTQTADRVMVLNTNKQIVASGINTTKLSYLDNVSSDIQTQLNAKLNLSGSNANQNIVLSSYKVQSSAVPSTGDDYTNKTYVDSAISGAGSLYVLKAGDTMTGTLAMGANKVTSSYTPVNADDLTRKGYVDTQLALKMNLSGGNTITGNQTYSDNTASTVAIFDASKNLKSSTVTTTTLGFLDATSSIQTQLDSKAPSSALANYLPLTGGTLSGALTISSGALTISSRLLGVPDATTGGNFWIGLTGSDSESNRVAISVIGNQTTGTATGVSIAKPLYLTSTVATAINQTVGLTDNFAGVLKVVQTTLNYNAGSFQTTSLPTGLQGGTISASYRLTATASQSQMAMSINGFTYYTGEVYTYVFTGVQASTALTLQVIQTTSTGIISTNPVNNSITTSAGQTITGSFIIVNTAGNLAFSFQAGVLNPFVNWTGFTLYRGDSYINNVTTNRVVINGDNLPYANRGSNPVGGQLIVGDSTTSERLYLGASYTGGVGSACIIQASDYYSASDHANPLIINPIGGNVGIYQNSPQWQLHVNKTNDWDASVGGYNANKAQGILALGGKDNDIDYQYLIYPNPCKTPTLGILSWWSADMITGRYRNEFRIAWWKETHGAPLGTSYKEGITMFLTDAGGYVNMDYIKLNGNTTVVGTTSTTGLAITGTTTISGSNFIDFGFGVTKETNAGRIGYKTFTTTCLDIVGATPGINVNTPRRVRIFDRLGVGRDPSTTTMEVEGGFYGNGNGQFSGLLDIGGSGEIRLTPNASGANCHLLTYAGAFVMNVGSQNVGIGLYNPSTKLEVNGTITASAIARLNKFYLVNGSGGWCSFGSFSSYYCGNYNLEAGTRHVTGMIGFWTNAVHLARINISFINQSTLTTYAYPFYFFTNSTGFHYPMVIDLLFNSSAVPAGNYNVYFSNGTLNMTADVNDFFYLVLTNNPS